MCLALSTLLLIAAASLPPLGEAIRTRSSHRLYAYFAENSSQARQAPSFVPSLDGRDEQAQTSQSAQDPNFFGRDAWRIMQMPQYPGGGPGAAAAAAAGPCEPRCSWTCAPSEVCDQVCEPICAPPTCQVSCRKSADKCETRCSPPKCAVVCPTKMCDSCPKCRTVCAPPQCTTMCTDSCTKSCQKPLCSWKCKQPECPKPKCKMSCVGLDSCPVPPGNASALYDVGAGASVVGEAAASLDPASLAEPVTAPPPWEFPPGPAPGPAPGPKAPAPAPAPAAQAAVAGSGVSLHPGTRGEQVVTVEQLEDRWARQDGLAAGPGAGRDSGDGAAGPPGSPGLAEGVLGPLFQAGGAGEGGGQ